MSEKNKESQQEMSGMMLWAVFLVIFVSGMSALIFFPAQVGYGSAATIIFRVIIAGALIFVCLRFYKGLKELERLNKGGRG